MPDLSKIYMKDWVFPIANLDIVGSEIEYKGLLGSGFILPGNKHFMTAAHVLNANITGRIAAMRTTGDTWVVVQLENVRYHPTEDIALCDVDIPEQSLSRLQPFAAVQSQAVEYHIWGYPEDALYDHDQINAMAGKLFQIPTLVLSKGYIKRRLSYGGLGFTGTMFLELSENAGHGCSGGPMYNLNSGLLGAGIFPVCGVYIGEKVTEQGGKPMYSRGYAIPIETIADWLRAQGVSVG